MKKYNKISSPRNQIATKDEFPLGLNDYGSESLPKDIRHVTVDEYKIMQQHDPNTIYILIDDIHHSIYRGDERIVIYENKPIHQYVLSYDQDHDTYIILLRYGHMNHEMLIPLSEYKSPQVAINVLTRLNTLGFDPNNISQILQSMIDKTINAFDAIIGILNIFGFNFCDPRIQEIIAISNRYYLWKQNNVEIPNAFVDELQVRLSDPHTNRNTLMKYFIDIYLIFYRYKFFKNEEFIKNPNTSLKVPIREIYHVFK